MKFQQNWQRLLGPVVALVVLWAVPLRAQDRQIKLAVIGISNPSTLQKSNIGNALVDILDSDISAAGKYALLERSDLDQVMKEKMLDASDQADPSTLSKLGGLSGADFLLLGKVSDYTYKETSSVKTKYVLFRGFVQVMEYDHVGKVRVDLRLVDVKTGEVVRSVLGEGSDHNTGAASFQQEWYIYTMTGGQGALSDLSTLLTNASNNAIQNAVRKLNDMYSDLAESHSKRSLDVSLAQIGQGKILASVGQGQYVIGVQSTATLKVGDRFHVIGESVVKNSQGVVVYREKHAAGTLQVTDISESDRAMARQIDANSNFAPKENDTVLFDQNYGKSLRGMAAPSAGGAVTGGASAESGTQSYLDRGNRLLGQKDYSEALEQFKKGVQAQPNSAALLAGKAFAEAGVHNFTDAEADGEKAIAAGGSLTFPIAHLHFGGYCTGNLVLQRGSISFQPTSGDHGFTATTGSQISIADGGSLGLPALIVHWQGQDHKDHKYNMTLLSYLTPGGTSGTLTLLKDYHLEGDGEQSTISLGHMIERLVKASLP